MRIFLITSILLCFGIGAYAQEIQIKTRLSMAEMAKRVTKCSFKQVPQDVRERHGTGTATLLIYVNQEGKVYSVSPLTKLGPVTDYLRTAVLDWKFRPLEENGTRVTFKGLIQVPFWYGAFANPNAKKASFSDSSCAR